MEANWKTWAEGLDSKGLPASEALRLYLALQAKHAGR